MYEIIEKKLEIFEAELRELYSLYVNCNHSTVKNTLSKKINILEEVIAELYDILNEAIIQGKAPMSAHKLFKPE